MNNRHHPLLSFSWHCVPSYPFAALCGPHSPPTKKSPFFFGYLLTLLPPPMLSPLSTSWSLPWSPSGYTLLALVVPIFRCGPSCVFDALSPQPSVSPCVSRNQTQLPLVCLCVSTCVLCSVAPVGRRSGSSRVKSAFGDLPSYRSDLWL
jgi:hypothetical protein